VPFRSLATPVARQDGGRLARQGGVINMTEELIAKHYQKMHSAEALRTGQKIPQTMLGKKIRYLLKLIDCVESLNK